MFELPELLTLARQINETIAGLTVTDAIRGNTPHKFVWYNREPDEFVKLTVGKRTGAASVRGRWMFVRLETGFVLTIGEFGGKILYHPPGRKRPAKHHMLLELSDGGALSATTQMWGAIEVFRDGEELERKYIKGMRPTPVDTDFTFDYFAALCDESCATEKRSAKGLLTQEQLIPGLGNSIAQDILFAARMSPKRPVREFGDRERRALYDAILKTVRAVTNADGRNDEFDLHGRPGRYQRIMDKNAPAKPCPRCGSEVRKIQYLGGACYFCQECQK